MSGTEFNKRNGKKAIEKTDKSFWDVYNEFTAESGNKNQWTTATYEKFAALKNHLINLNPNLSAESLDY